MPSAGRRATTALPGRHPAQRRWARVPGAGRVCPTPRPSRSAAASEKDNLISGLSQSVDANLPNGRLILVFILSIRTGSNAKITRSKTHVEKGKDRISRMDDEE